MEILAPAGSPEAMKSAVFSGADAVYFGGGEFNARARAKNFTNEEIAQGIRFCRERGVKCYAAMNTLIADREMEKALKMAEFFVNCGIDAFIVQDAGFASLLKKATGIPLHASTQMTVHTLDGVLALAEAGFTRVVVSRELSQAELRHILLSSPCEIEVFVHGALCMCYSGQCYMSSLIGKRSGNRGECAQPCRLPYKEGYALSLKDLSLLRYVEDLRQMGVTSLKIEGRMKSPEYVAAVTGVYAAARDGKPYLPEDEEKLAGIFSRGGFTDGYYAAKKGKSMFGVRSESTEKAALPAKEYKRLSLSVSAVAKKDLLQVTYASSDRLSAEETIPLQQAKTQPPDKERIRAALCRFGDGFYKEGTFSLQIPDDVFIPVSALNHARRNCIARLSEMRTVTAGGFRTPEFPKKPDPPKEQTLRAVFHHPEILDQIPDRTLNLLQTVWLPLPWAVSKKAEQTADRLGKKLGYFLPRIFFDSQKPEIMNFLAAAEEQGVNRFLCGNIGQVKMLAGQNKEIHGDFGLNIFNGAAAAAFEEKGIQSLILSFELSAPRLRDLRGENRGMIAYGRLPFMITENCVKKEHHKPGRLTDRMGKNFPVTCEYGCRNSVWNSEILYLADQDLSFASFLQLIFTDETAEQAKRVTEAYLPGAEKPAEPPVCAVTRGRFRK